MGVVTLSVELSNRFVPLVGTPLSLYFKARLFVDPGARSGYTPFVVMLIDTSSSMVKEKKIRLAKEAVKRLITLMPRGSRVSIIAFDSSVREVAECRSLDEECRERMLARVSRLIAFGNTVLYRALSKGLEKLRELGGSNVIRRLIIVTDGIPTDVKEVKPYGELARKAGEEGVEIIAIGVGREYNEEVLEAIAVNSRGVMEHIEDPADIPKVVELYASRYSAIAFRDSYACVVPSAPVSTLEVFSAEQFERDGAKCVRLGALSAGETRRIYGRLTLTPQSIGELKLLKVELVADGEKVAEAVARVRVVERRAAAISEGAKREVASEALAVASIVRNDLEVARTVSVEDIGEEEVREALKTYIHAVEQEDRKVLTSLRTKTLKHLV